MNVLRSIGDEPQISFQMYIYELKYRFKDSLIIV